MLLNLDMENQLVKRVVLDTNVLISAIGFGGKPRQVLTAVLKKELSAVTSPILLAELEEILGKKLDFEPVMIQLILKEIENEFIIVHPSKTIKVLSDDDDNRVLEAAQEGKCNYIITGDKELLELKKYKSISILTPDSFLSLKDKS